MKIHLPCNSYYGFYTGPLSDYRADLTLLAFRLQSFLNPPPTPNKYSLYSHTFLDSLAYATVRLFHMINSGSVSDEEIARWNLVVYMCGVVMRDTFEVEKPVLFLRGHDEEPFYADVESAIEDILNRWEIPYISLTNISTAATLIEDLILEAENDSSAAVTASISGED